MPYKLQDLNHLRLLRLMARDFTVAELHVTLQKLRVIIEERREEERLLQERYAKHSEKIQHLLALLRAEGIQLEEIANHSICPRSDTARNKHKVRPAKYRFTDLCGVTKTWTGQGRMPKIMARALQQGKSLKDFLI